MNFLSNNIINFRIFPVIYLIQVTQLMFYNLIQSYIYVVHRKRSHLILIYLSNVKYNLRFVLQHISQNGQR